VTGTSGIRALGAGLALAALLALSACGDDDDEETTCAGSPESEASPLTYEVGERGGATPGQMRRTIEILCGRTRALGIEGAVVSADGANRITVFVPEGTPRGVGDELDRAARLRFYDWEGNLIRAPGASTALAEPITSYGAARRLASEQDEAIVIRAEPPRQGFFVIRNRPDLANRDVRNLRQDADPATGNPTISFEFTALGRRRFARLTRRIAERAGRGSTPHFAVVVDAEVVALPTVDVSENPSGLDTPGLTLLGAIPIEEAETLTEFLEIGHLPVDLRLAGPGPRT